MKRFFQFGVRATVFAAALAMGGCVDADDAPEPDITTRLSSASTAGLSVRMREGMVRTLRGRFEPTGSGTGEARAQAFVSTWAELFGVDPDRIDSELVTVGARGTATAKEIIDFERHIDGVPLFGGAARVHVQNDGAVTFVSTSLAEDLQVDTTPTLSASDASARAAEIIGLVDPSSFENLRPPELLVFNRGMISGEPSPSVLVWRVSRAPVGATRREFFVDAHDGQLRYAIDTMPSARTRVTWTAQNQTDMTMLLAGSGERWLTESGMEPGTMPDQQGFDAHDYALLLHDYYATVHGHSGIDGMDSPIQSFVHYGSPSSGPNAHGSVDGLFFHDSMVTLEIYAHEFTHGVIAATSGLWEGEESGAVNESMSDVFAMFAGRSTSWEIGSGSVLGVFRSLEDPTRFMDPITYGTRARPTIGGPCGPGGDCGTSTCTDAAGDCIPGCSAPMGCDGTRCFEIPDRCGNDMLHAHSNAGIASQAAWRISRQGVTHMGQRAIGIGDDKTERIYFKALSEYFQTLTDLTDARDMLVDACAEFNGWYTALGVPNFGIGARDCGVVINSFFVAELGEGDKDFDSWSDSEDNCPDDFNPSQANIDGDRLGNACDPDERSVGDLPPYPREPPSVPSCPPSFPSTIAEDPTWPLVEAVGPGRHEDIYGDLTPIHFFTMSCRYESNMNASRYMTYVIEWQPFDQTEYGTGEHPACRRPGFLDTATATVRLNSSDKQASAFVGNSNRPAAIRGQVEAFLAPVVAAGEAVARDCP